MLKNLPFNFEPIKSPIERIKEVWSEHMSTLKRFYNPVVECVDLADCGILGRGSNKRITRLCVDESDPSAKTYATVETSPDDMLSSVSNHLQILTCYLIDRANGFNLPFKIPLVYRCVGDDFLPEYMMDVIPGDIKSQYHLANLFRFDYYEDMVIFHTWVRERCKVDPIDCEYYSDGHQIWVTDFGECRPFRGDTESAVKALIDHNRPLFDMSVKKHGLPP